MSNDAYLSVRNSSEGLYKELGSKFIASVHPVSSEEEVEQRLNAIRKEHPKARHYCYAYKLGFGENRYRMNDDGEPSGTAGRPIYGQIISAKVTNTLVVVVRYFGGTKLGASGLVHAYKTAAEDALSGADIVKKYRQRIFELELPYDHFGSAMDVLKSIKARILHQEFEERTLLRISLPRSQGKAVITSALEEIYSTPDLSWNEISDRTTASVRIIGDAPE